MGALVVFETMFGNTRLIAEAIAGGIAESGELEVETVDVAEASRTLPGALRLLVVGGPTHAFAMSRPATRRSAVGSGGHPLDVEFGIREWLAGLPRTIGGPVVATFDTRVKIAGLPGSAARGAARAARRRGLAVVDTRSFFATELEGPLRDGELERATEWGRALAERLTRR
jgi:hypothetical protein